MRVRSLSILSQNGAQFQRSCLILRTKVPSCVFLRPVAANISSKSKRLYSCGQSPQIYPQRPVLRLRCQDFKSLVRPTRVSRLRCPNFKNGTRQVLLSRLGCQDFKSLVRPTRVSRLRCQDFKSDLGAFYSLHGNDRYFRSESTGGKLMIRQLRQLDHLLGRRLDVCEANEPGGAICRILNITATFQLIVIPPVRV